MKMKQRKKFPYSLRVNVTMKNADKKMNENIVLTKYWT